MSGTNCKIYARGDVSLSFDENLCENIDRKAIGERSYACGLQHSNRIYTSFGADGESSDTIGYVNSIFRRKWVFH